MPSHISEDDPHSSLLPRCGSRAISCRRGRPAPRSMVQYGEERRDMPSPLRHAGDHRSSWIFDDGDAFNTNGCAAVPLWDEIPLWRDRVPPQIYFCATKWASGFAAFTFRILRESLCVSFSAREGGGVGYLRRAMRACVSVLHLHRDVQTLQVLAPATSRRSGGHAPAYHIQEQNRHVPSIAKAARCLGDPSPPARISSGGTWRRS
jgi:hypothetical protein